VHIEVATGQKWLSLPEDLRRRICVEILEQRADPTWLAVLENMQKQEPSELRLTAICAKALCDHQEYARAFAAIRRSIVDRAERTFSQDAEPLMQDLAPYGLDMQVLSGVKRYVDLQNRKDAFSRPTSDGEIERVFALAHDKGQSLLPRLQGQYQVRLLFALLDLAESTDSEDCILDIAELFTHPAVKKDLRANSDITRRLQNPPIYPRNLTRRAQFIEQFSNHNVKARIVQSERAFLRQFQKDTGRCFEQWVDGTEQEAVELVSRALSFAASISSDAGTQLVLKAAKRLLRGLIDPQLKFEVAAALAHSRDRNARSAGVKVLHEHAANGAMEPGQTGTLVEALLDLNEAHLLRGLHARGLLDNLSAIHPSRLSVLYGTMGLFAEGAVKMKQARSAAIASFSETAASGTFHTATAHTDEISEFEFSQECSDILNSVPQPKQPRGLLVIVAKGPHELNQYPILALRELKQRGFAVVPLVVGTMDYQPTGIAEIDELANQFNLGLDYARCEVDDDAPSQPVSHFSPLPKFLRQKAYDKANWVWAPQDHELSYAGVNAYWGIREDICCVERRYTIDFGLPRYRPYLADIKKRIQTWEILLRKIAAVGKARDIPVRLILQYIHLSTHYYCRKYVEAASAEQDISVIHSAIAYENYFRNFAKDESTTLAVQDMTRLTDLAASSYAPADWFLRHYQSLSDAERDRIVEAVERVVKQNRLRRDADSDAQQRLQFFKSERERGRRIIALFGKVLFDQGLPRGDGVVHEDMRDWFNHSIDIARRNPNLHLVIKPHPHELREEIALYSSEVLKDWLRTPTPQNVHFLGNDEFNLHELADVLDMALVWNGMSAVELGVLRVPTILGAYYGVINFPVGHVAPTSRQDFERLIMTYSKNELPNEVRRMSAALIDYLRHPDVSVPYRYTYRGLTNKHIALRWFEEDLQAYEANGDKYIKVLADRLEGVSYGKHE
jgi:hypothetical protein